MALGAGSLLGAAMGSWVTAGGALVGALGVAVVVGLGRLVTRAEDPRCGTRRTSPLGTVSAQSGVDRGRGSRGDWRPGPPLPPCSRLREPNDRDDRITASGASGAGANPAPDVS